MSQATSIQFLQSSFLGSSSALSIHLDFGRPLPRWPPGLVHDMFLGNSFLSIRATWPAHPNLLYFITLTVFGSLYRSPNSALSRTEDRTVWEGFSFRRDSVVFHHFLSQSRMTGNTTLYFMFVRHRIPEIQISCGDNKSQYFRIRSTELSKLETCKRMV